MNIITLSFILVLLGVCFLSGGIYHLFRILRIIRKRKQWYFLLGLILFFLLGYIAFAMGLIFRIPFATVLLVAFVYFFGAIFVLAVMRISASTVQDIFRMNEFRSLAHTDPLTDLFNRRYIMERLDNEICRAKRYKNSFSILMIDVDHFKAVNDTYGHNFGDTVLITIADAIKSTCRTGVDTPARYGGEEFMVLLPETKLADAAIIAERLRSSVASINFMDTDTKIMIDRSKRCFREKDVISVTISAGVADNELCREMDTCQVIDWADSALYRAKQEGRNRVILCTAPPGEESSKTEYHSEQDASSQDISSS